MFWRRSNERKDRGTREPRMDDDLESLQKQFGITPVSDKDVEAEMRQLLGSTAPVSPSAEFEFAGLLDDGDDEEEEAKILRELHIQGSLKSLDMDKIAAMSDEEDGDGDHDHEYDEKDEDSAQEERQRAPMTRTRVEVGSVQSSRADYGSGVRAGVVRRQGDGGEVEEMEATLALTKKRVLELKRVGKIPEALQMLKEVERCEQSLRERKERHWERNRQQPQQEATVPRASRGGSGSGSGSGVEVAQRPMQRMPSSLDARDDDVELTEEDMQNPEYLAELAALGFQDQDVKTRESPIRHEDTIIATLEAQIREAQTQAVQLKRMNRVTEAVAALHKSRDLEMQLSQLRAEMVAPTQSAPSQANVSASMIPPAIISIPDEDEEPQIELTDEDMNDPELALQLKDLGYEDDSSTSDATAPVAEVVRRTVFEPAFVKPSFRSIPSIDGDDLIDEFEDEDEHSHGIFGVTTPPAHERQQLSVRSAAAPTVYTPAAPVVSAFESEPLSFSSGFSVEDLEAQLSRSKAAALRYKNDGDMSSALEMMRRIKQIENLIAMKQQQPRQPEVIPAPTLSPAEQLRARRFDELEQLLVRFGNFAGDQAKAQLAVDRAKSAQWLARYKSYQADLQQLHQRRVLVGQEPPTFRVETMSEEVEVVDATIPMDELHMTIGSIQGLPQASNKEVFVKFCLNFPSSAPYEGRTGTVRISSKSPHVGQASPPISFAYKVQRTRGALRIFGIKKAVFEVWRNGTILRNPELIARGYQELATLLTSNHIKTRIPFVGSNRKPIGGDIEITLKLRTPLRDREFQTIVTQVLHIDPYPEISAVVLPSPTPISNPLRESYSSRGSLIERFSASARNSFKMAAEPEVDLGDPYDLNLIVSYDVINEEIAKIEAKLPSVSGMAAAELQDRLDSLALKRQVLEIEIETGKLTMEMYMEQLRTRIAEDNTLLRRLMKANRRSDAARVLHRVKIMEKELQGAESATQGEQA